MRFVGGGGRFGFLGFLARFLLFFLGLMSTSILAVFGKGSPETAMKPITQMLILGVRVRVNWMGLLQRAV